VAAFPILRHARIAGGLLVSSARDFFFTPAHLAIIEEYSYLISCIFEDEEFFDPAQIELRMMPRYTLQIPYFVGYARRVSQKFAEASTSGQRPILQRARELVSQDLEEVLLRVFLDSETAERTEETEPAATNDKGTATDEAPVQSKAEKQEKATDQAGITSSGKQHT
jgi:hypothetical protein